MMIETTRNQQKKLTMKINKQHPIGLGDEFKMNNIRIMGNL